MLVYLRNTIGFLLLYPTLIKCQVPFTGSCPKVETVKSFDLEGYMGTWYEYSKYPNIVELFQKCQKVVYATEGDDSVSVVNTGAFVITNNSYKAIGKGKLFAPGELVVVFQDQNPNTLHYLILGTDYKNWAVVYSCKVITSFSHTKLLWIFTRESQPNEEVITAAKQVLAENDLSETFLIQSSQAECSNLSEETGDDGDQASL